MSKALRLGQGGSRTGKPVWLTITFRNGQYVTWAEQDEEEYREIFEIPADEVLPRICVNRLNTTARAEYVRKHLRKYSKVGKTVPPEIRERVVRDSIAHEMLVDWENIAVDDGEPTAYSPDMGIEAFKKDEDFYEAVLAAGMDEEYHRSEAVKQDADVLGEA